MVQSESLGVTTAPLARAQANDRGMTLHQGGMCDTPSGEWWCIIMSDRGGIGRLVSLCRSLGTTVFRSSPAGQLRKAPNTWIKPNTGYTQEAKPAFVNGSFWLTHAFPRHARIPSRLTFPTTISTAAN